MDDVGGGTVIVTLVLIEWCIWLTAPDEVTDTSGNNGSTVVALNNIDN